MLGTGFPDAWQNPKFLKNPQKCVCYEKWEKKKSLKPEVNNQVDLNNERIAIPFCRGSKVIGMEDLMAHFSAGCHTPSYWSEHTRPGSNALL